MSRSRNEFSPVNPAQMAPKKAPPKATKAKADAPPEQTEDELLGLLAAKELEAARAREKLQQ